MHGLTAIHDKECLRCGERKPLHDFSINKRARDGRQYSCRLCQSKTAAKTQANRRALIASFKLQQGCADCGYNEYPEALDFDHVRGSKEFAISDQLQVRWERIVKEIAKCEVVCANCHRHRTFVRRIGGDASGRGESFKEQASA